MHHLLFILVSCFCIFFIKCNNECSKTICNPTAGDLLIGRESLLKASSTCGLQSNERYCVVTLTDRGSYSKCSICYSKDPYNPFSSPNSHRIENVVSRVPQDSGRWWQSTNGIHNSSIEVSFETEFQFIHTQLRFKTYRPAAMYIERSKDYGYTWQKSAYFSDNCVRDFPNITQRNRNNIEDVSCTSEFSSISPSEDGTVLFAASPSDLHNKNLDWAEKRNELTAITNLRVQFVRLHTFGDWKIDNNPNILNKYYYAVSEWIIQGRCSCYGHASRCLPKEGQVQKKEMVYGICICQHNTMGQHCQKCKDFFNDKPWMPAEINSTNDCKKCNCNSHSMRCHFDPVVYDLSEKISGGVCDNCLHNTDGKNCQLCKSGYYKNSAVPLSSVDTCLKCKCDAHGSKHPNTCVQKSDPEHNSVAGSCVCKENVDGFYCDRCKTGFWKFEKSNQKGCTECKCLMIGTLNGQGCDSTSGRCFCKAFVDGKLCNTCKEGYYNLSSANPLGCNMCECSEHGSMDYGKCDKYSGQCKCKPGYTGRTCNEIKDGWYIDSPRYSLRYRENVQIELPPVSKSGFYNFIITTDTHQVRIIDTFVMILSIDHNIKSTCQSYQDTISITKDTKNIVVPNKCLLEDLPIIISVFIITGPSDRSIAPNIVDVVVVPMLSPSSADTRIAFAECLKHPIDSMPTKCNFLKVDISSRAFSNSIPKTCQCNVTGSINNVCNKFVGQCICLPNVAGNQCDQCSRNAYSFDARGCKSCDCDPSGSLDLQCASDTGKCLCRTGIEGRHCNYCKKGFWRFPFCEPCKCHSMADVCDQKTGQCINCRSNSFGFNCQQCNKGYYGDPSRNLLCLKCKCPGLAFNLNHSIKCSLIFNTSSYMCLCKPGFRGQFCDECDVNYFGNPREKNGECNKCHCSQNIDRNIAGSCDSRTGECKKCMYNTAGFNCEKCATGYFGNGVTRTCKQCVCNKLGTGLMESNVCHHETGKCVCLPNVIGGQCDRCLSGFFNLSSGKGCVPCECDTANGAINVDCNSLTGQCHCREGRSGRQCDKCEDGYWGDPLLPRGCKVCMCDPMGSVFNQCDRTNGACRCRSGIVGRHCDQCARGTEGTMPNCSPCGDCWAQWDQIINELIISLIELESGSMNNMTAIAQPEKLLIVIQNINRLMTSIEAFFKSVPQDIGSQTVLLQFHLNILRMELENIKMLNFNSNEFNPTNIIKSIRDMQEFVANNEIQDVKGAYLIILKSLKAVTNIIDGTKTTLQWLSSVKTVTKNREDKMAELNFEMLETKSKELSNIEIILKESLQLFNSLTCKVGLRSDTDLCSDQCGGVGCKPNNCIRPVTIGAQCLATDSSNEFFNAVALKLDNNRMVSLDYFKEVENKMRKDISKRLTNSRVEVDATKRLIGVTNKAIGDSYIHALKLLNGLMKTVSTSVSEEEFKRIILAIRDFRLSTHELEIARLERLINNRIQQLSVKVNDVLAKSNETRRECDFLKMEALKARTNASDLLNSIKDLEDNHRKTLKIQLETRLLLLTFDSDFIQVSKELNEIKQSQSKTDNNRSIIFKLLAMIKLLNASIENSKNKIGAQLNLIESDQITIGKQLNNIKLRFDNAKLKKESVIKNKEVMQSKNEGKRREMLDNIKELGKKITNARIKIANAKQSIGTRQTELLRLSGIVEEKVQRFTSLEHEIYSKSEFQAYCLP